MIEVTVLNNRDVELIPGEKVKLDVPKHRRLPISVYSLEGVLMGYLGRNEMTCAKGTRSSQEAHDMLNHFTLIDAVVDHEVFHATKERKMVVQLIFEEEESFIVA